ncbi:glycosyltransferase [Acinetobacter sp. YH12227]|uniref:glycosyltransferase n=1 Tax=Acinetobacter sp. YH12227 TaxID=2601158 RepID=UPI0015D3C61A|nr:glycosyltransferase [Acinetobacter sp. YH12227]
MSSDLSIIIPVYNSKDYILDCVNSIKILDNTNYEIIIVNDGSSDNSLDIINLIASENPRVRIISQENKGLGGARNTGILNSNGKYVLFLDSDDRLNLNIFNKYLKKDDFDILEFSVNFLNEDGIIKSTLKKQENIISKVGVDYTLKFGFESSACNKIYNLNFLLRNNIFFKEKIYCEDIHFNSRAFYFAKNVRSTSEILENIYLTSNSITRGDDPVKKNKLSTDLMFVFDDLKYFFNEQNFSTKKYSKLILGDLALGIIHMNLKLNRDASLYFNFFKENKLYFYSYGMKKNIYKFFLINKISFMLLSLIYVFKFKN